jgi:hypothetical protein
MEDMVTKCSGNKQEVPTNLLAISRGDDLKKAKVRFVNGWIIPVVPDV